MRRVWQAPGSGSPAGSCPLTGQRELVPRPDGRWHEGELVYIHPGADLPDVVGLGAASDSSVYDQ